MSLLESQQKTAVILLNLGGPEKVEDVRPFLYNLFSDRLIIRLGPAFMQKPLAWWIAKKRAPKSQGYYRQIGGGSPLNLITAQQCDALEQSLNATGNFKVVMAMRYWKPFAREVLADLASQGIQRLIALTLYPHYSIATTGSSLRDLQDVMVEMPGQFELAKIASWPDQNDYVDCLVQRIQAALSDKAEAEVVYSAHSLPVKFIDEGDPYLDHLKRTIQAIEEKTGVKGHLCFQSRSGPVEWLAPSTPDTIEKLAKNGCKKIVMVPISFVSDHVETLCEIDIQYKALAAGFGVELARTPSLNVDPLFIKALNTLVLTACNEKGWS
nr:ferrochelatase [Desulfobulbaceae bacterium]